MGKRIVIAGAGGFGRGVYGWISSSPEHLSEHDISDIVFIDDGDPQIDPVAPIISAIKDYRPLDHDAVVCAIGDPATRRTLAAALRSVKARFHTFVDDRAIIGSRVRIGDGAVICPGVILSADVVIDEQVHINMNCTVGHDVHLGAFTTLSPAVNIMGEVSVGQGVFFGGSAVILPRINIEDDVTIGAGSVVLRDASQSDMIVGNPGRSR